MRERHILRVHYHLGDRYDPELYERLIQQLHGICPRAQALPPADVDCDITGALRYWGQDPHGLAQVVRMRTFALYGVRTTIGSAGNRMLAAMAMDATEPGGVTHLPPEAVRSFLRPRPVAALYGVGPALAAVLTRHGLHTVGAVADTPPATLQRLLGRAQGRQLSERAHGLDHRPVTAREPARSLGADHAFPYDELDPFQQRRAVLGLAERVGMALRAEERVTRRLTLTVRYADRSTTTRARTLPEATDHGPVLIRAARELHEGLGLQRARVRGFSLRADELRPAAEATTQLTFDPADERARRVESSADRARERFGPAAVHRASLAGG
ncbi:ImpB/MucB/SamB family protein [Streptomyces sp. NPDC057638]|uniref:DNA polymerase Y family protein n=1 Tax=Streptomyces sp. NPDC057638 TaxID=3346190 RepID=UPI0036C57A01